MPSCRPSAARPRSTRRSSCHDHGILDKYDVELIGANFEAINKGEDRQIFKQLVLDAGADVARSHIAHTVDEAIAAAADLGYPLVIRPSFTMGGLGSGFAYDEPELVRMVADGLHQSPTTEVLMEESILGWKEYELELMRDTADNTVVVCSIENVDPVGVHTGGLDHGRAGAHAPPTASSRICATSHRHHPGGRGGHGRLQHPVRGRSRDRTGHRDRDEPAGFALLRPRVEGDRVPDRQDRGQARDRLPARRDPQRHHARDPGLVRADARLRRREGSALRVREVSRRRHDPDHDHEVGGRGHGHRAELHDGAAEGAAFAREAGERLPLGRPARRQEPAARAGERADRRPDRDGAAGAARGRDHRRGVRGDRHRPLVPRPDRADQRGRGRDRDPSAARCHPVAARQGPRVQRHADRPAARLEEQQVRNARWSVGVRPVYKTVDTCRGEFPALNALSLLELRPRDRGSAERPAQGHHPRVGAEPHRPGHRVRLQLRPRLVRALRRGLRDHHDQLQPETVSTDYDTSDGCISSR